MTPDDYAPVGWSSCLQGRHTARISTPLAERTATILKCVDCGDSIHLSVMTPPSSSTFSLPGTHEEPK